MKKEEVDQITESLANLSVQQGAKKTEAMQSDRESREKIREMNNAIYTLASSQPDSNVLSDGNTRPLYVFPKPTPPQNTTNPQASQKPSVPVDHNANSIIGIMLRTRFFVIARMEGQDLGQDLFYQVNFYEFLHQFLLIDKC